MLAPGLHFYAIYLYEGVIQVSRHVDYFVCFGQHRYGRKVRYAEHKHQGLLFELHYQYTDNLNLEFTLQLKRVMPSPETYDASEIDLLDEELGDGVGFYVVKAPQHELAPAIDLDNDGCMVPLSTIFV